MVRESLESLICVFLCRISFHLEAEGGDQQALTDDLRVTASYSRGFQGAGVPPHSGLSNSESQIWGWQTGSPWWGVPHFCHGWVGKRYPQGWGGQSSHPVGQVRPQVPLVRDIPYLAPYPFFNEDMSSAGSRRGIPMPAVWAGRSCQCRCGRRPSLFSRHLHFWVQPVQFLLLPRPGSHDTLGPCTWENQLQSG